MVDVIQNLVLIEKLQEICLEMKYNLEIGFPPKENCFFLEIGKQGEYYEILEGVYIENNTYLCYQSSSCIIKDVIDEYTDLKEVADFPNDKEE